MLGSYDSQECEIQCSPFITLCLGSLGMDPVISESWFKGQFYKGLIGT